MMSGAREFRHCYVRAMALAAIMFAIAHGCQLLIRGLASQHSFVINPTGFIVLFPYMILEALIFFVAGGVVAYLPSRAGNKYLSRRGKKYRVYSVLFGLIMGVIFLPVCASVPFFAFPLPDDPSYFARCVEFGLPMTISGALGGYAFWRCARGFAASGDFVADQFS
jgi:hypothetical protein